jgi:large subunit ribosomal protein L15
MGNKNRGSGTHGRGSSKKGRGAGNRGGRGTAGRGKKAKHKKQTGLAAGGFGEGGFSRPQAVATNEDTINIMDIDQRIEAFVADGVAEKDGDSYVFHADKAGYDKILAKGKLLKDIDIRAPSFSDSARDAIEEAGNEAIETDE